MINSRTNVGLFLAAFLVLSLALPYAHAVGVTATATITATCGFTVGAIGFGNVARDGVTGVDAVSSTVTNSGSVNSVVTVNGADWKDTNSVVHIDGELTKFATTDQGSSGTGVAYGSKTALNSTNSDVSFGIARASATNATYWQLTATMQNLPFSGALTQVITFTGTCQS